MSQDKSEVFQTEFGFELPIGYADDTGTLHRKGRMRLATAADEILPLKDPRVRDNPAYLAVILLSRVVVNIGTIKAVNTRVIEELFARDFAFLQDLYNRINQDGQNTVSTACPKCGCNFEAEIPAEGE